MADFLAGRASVVLLPMRAEGLMEHLDALLLALAGKRSGWQDFAAMISAGLGGRPCPSPA
jgi:hypothetical protein